MARPEPLQTEFDMTWKVVNLYTHQDLRLCKALNIYYLLALTYFKRFFLDIRIILTPKMTRLLLFVKT